MSTERRWRLVWAAWGAAFVIAEGIALAGGDPVAPLSHHLRTALRAGETQAGAVALAAGAAWLINHLFREGSSSA